MTAIMITGGAGYIGSHVCKAVAAAGYTPVTFDDLSRGHAEAVRWGPLVVGNISDGTALDDAFRNHQIAGIIHLAAFAYVGESVSNPGLYYRNNVCGTLSLMEAAHRAGGLPMVFSSTCATYGIPHRVPIDESMPQNPINPYGRTKLHIEQMLADFETAHQQRWTALRYFNAAGADPDGETGEVHDPEPHVIPLAIAAAVSGGSMGVFGTDYPTPDGTAVRDYIHVSDLAAAHVLALKR
ncbi:MAG: UDP-glucose 4-epimerase GalE, partial [Rhodospirillaceae bacterium]